MTPLQCKMARAALGWGVRDLARHSGVAQQTVSRLESGEELRSPTVDKVRAAFEAAGVEFVTSAGRVGVVIGSASE